MSLLREIQSDLADRRGDVASVLRKCKILAARLRSEEFARWVEWELDGYPESQALPKYRRLSIIYYASFLSIAWRVAKAAVPVQMVPAKYRDSFPSIEFRDGIAKAESFSRAENGAVIQRPELAFLLQGIMYPEMQCQAVWGEIPSNEFEQLVSGVKNRVLDFSLRIESENPDAGEAPPNTEPVPMEKLRPLVNNFFGSVGNVAQQSDGVTQTASLGIASQDLADLVKELTQHL
jgi:hypothetical protein